MTEAPGLGSRLTGHASRLLLVSLAANLLLVGAFLGRWTMMPGVPPMPPGPAGMMGRMIDDMGRDLSEADRDILQRSYRAHEQAMRSSDSHRRDLFDAVRSSIAADPFDRAATQTAMEAAAAEEVVGRAVLEQTLLEAASQMSTEGRHRIAGWRPGPPPR